jgi:hypothetical protein
MWQKKRRKKKDPIRDQCTNACKLGANWVQIEIPKIFLKTIQVNHNKF